MSSPNQSRHRTFISGLAGIFALLAGAAPLGAAPATHIVAAGGQQLATALANAHPGDVLVLESGQHQGPITVAKPLTLVGETDAAIVGNGHGSVITVTAPDVTIGKLAITGSGISYVSLDAGIKLTKHAPRAIVRDCQLFENLIGVDIHGAADAMVTDNTIIGRRDLRMNERGNGVYVWNAPGAKVIGNRFQYGRDGIFVNTSRNNIFHNNVFRDLRFAVHYMYANDSAITNNHSSGNHLGYAVMFSRNVTVANNHSIGDRDHGIMLNYATASVVTGNVVRDGGTKCMFMYNAHDNHLAGNEFTHCPIGIHFTAGSQRNRITGNTFRNNRTQVKYVGSRWLEWSVDGRGNYWSDHVAMDLNGDGMGDTPYRPNDLVDRMLWTQPAAKLLLGAPAVQLLRWAQSAFPYLLPGGITDSHPLVRAPAHTEIDS